MNARTFSATLNGVDGNIIEIEAAAQRALPRIQIAGLPGDVVKESRERVQACLNAMGYSVPSSRVVVHLSPASAKKQGSQFDLAIALSVLVAEGLLKKSVLEKTAFLGELALDGRVKSVPHVLPLLEALEKSDTIDTILLSSGNRAEASLLRSKKARFVASVADAIEYFTSGKTLETCGDSLLPIFLSDPSCLDKVRGQGLAKRALQVALAGRHHVLFIGPPGVGKTMLANCAPHLLPTLSPTEAVESAKHLSLAGCSPLSLGLPPFRAPHHSVSTSGLLGGGSGIVVPGEVTFAHHGVLFLDEFPEFSRSSIEGLREPLQNGEIHIHRVGARLSLPARFTLLLAMNPCPCGHFFSSGRRCRCTQDQVSNYRKRVSGPLIDRIDLLVVLSAPGKTSDVGSSGERIARSVEKAIRMQHQRYQGVKRNGDQEAPPAMTEKATELWESLLHSGQWSYRGVAKLGKVARTLADLDDSEVVGLSHLLEAKLLRCPESLTQYWR